VLGLLVFAGQALAAPVVDSLSEDLFLGEVPVILSATRLAQPLSESPAATTVIDRRMIEASGARNIPDVLRLVPGFQVGHPDALSATVTYHGLSDAYARRMQVLVDGRSVYSPLFGGVYWTDIPLAIEDIDRIEVIRGPNGVTYGANSFSAIINIITRTPTQDIGAYIGHSQGDNNERRTVARYAGGAGDFHYRLTAGYEHDDGLDIKRAPDTQSSRLFTFRGDYRLNTRDTLDIQFGALNGPRERGDREHLDTDPLHDRDVDANFLQLALRRALGPEEELAFNLYRDYRRADQAYPITAVLPLSATVSQDMTTERTNLEFQHTFRAARDHRFVWGAEARLDRVTGGNYFFSTKDTHDQRLFRLFANDEWRFATNWITNFGAMYEDNEVNDGEFSPRLAIIHAFSSDHSWRAAYSRAWRTPSLIEHDGDGRICATPPLIPCVPTIRGNPSLESERIDSYEIGYRGSFADRTLSVDLKLFHEKIDGLVSIVDDAGVAGFVNNGGVNIDGWETQLDWRPRPGTRLVLAHAYARQHGRILVVTTPPEYADTDDSTPSHTTSLLAMQTLPYGLEASAAYYLIDNMRWLGFTTSNEDTGDYEILDARLAYRLRVGGVRGTIALVGQNMLGPYSDYWNRAAMGRRTFLNLSLEFR
jgi:iron complex outermembrane receptor protein